MVSSSGVEISTMSMLSSIWTLLLLFLFVSNRVDLIHSVNEQPIGQCARNGSCGRVQESELILGVLQGCVDHGHFDLRQNEHATRFVHPALIEQVCGINWICHIGSLPDLRSDRKQVSMVTMELMKYKKYVKSERKLYGGERAYLNFKNGWGLIVSEVPKSDPEAFKVIVTDGDGFWLDADDETPVGPAHVEGVSWAEVETLIEKMILVVRTR